VVSRFRSEVGCRSEPWALLGLEDVPSRWWLASEALDGETSPSLSGLHRHIALSNPARSLEAAAPKGLRLRAIQQVL